MDNENIKFGTTSHYNQYQGFEVIDVCEQLRAPDGSGNFNRGNAFKYLARAGWKSIDKQLEDLEKAKNYIQREIDRLSTCNHPPKTVCEPLSCTGSSCVLDHPPVQTPKRVGFGHEVTWVPSCPVCGVRMEDHWTADRYGKYVCPKGHGHMAFVRGEC